MVTKKCRIQKIFVPAKTMLGAKKQFKKEVNSKYWELVGVRTAKPREYPYGRTGGYKTYVLLVKNKKCKVKKI